MCCVRFGSPLAPFLIVRGEVQHPQQPPLIRKGDHLQSGAECRHAGHIVHSGNDCVQKAVLYNLWPHTLAVQREDTLLLVAAPPQGPSSCALLS
eukprot:CAMPEP_0172879904 /NCGR_PEP_ID=MMETSP1075-20121228/113737_2 /TAXON_ID=2916 /ORGANISM="Ceratium fusus, Strain PA161109" /LENGTH=93 /DNA_ID=CAMNT_0013732001 /DNA_START=708 /DNA_END=989 /DNA_ORIENTATION=-